MNRSLYRFLIIIIITASSIILVSFGMNVKNIVKKHVTMLGYGAFGQITSHKNALENYFSKAIQFNKKFSLPEISILIKDDNFKKIVQKREKALLDGILIKTSDDPVDGKIFYEGKELSISIRLKGDYVEHLEHENKWSFRIQVKGDDYFGMEEFSIQHPKQREFQSEPLFYAMLKDFGIITPRHFFVNLTINNKNIGIMALEEHFSEEILKNNNKPRGVIFKYSEDLLWPRRLQDASVLYENFYNNEITPFDKKTVFNDTDLYEQFISGRDLLRSLKNENTVVSDIFDAEKIGRYLAIIDVWGARHALFWHNLRFYFNPIINKFEPIAFDASMSYRENYEDRSVEKEEFSRILMKDELIFEEYLKTLNDIEEYLTTNLTLKKLDNKFHSELINEFFYVPKFDFENLKYRLYNVKLDTFVEMKYDNVHDIEYDDLIKSSFLSSMNEANMIQLINISPFSITLLNIKDESGNNIDFLTQESDKYLKGRETKNIKLNFRYPIDKVYLDYKLTGESYKMQEKLVRF